MKKLLLVALCMMALPGHALLAPLHQNIREIRALLNSQELIGQISSADVITDIKCHQENVEKEGKEVFSRAYLITTTSEQFLAKVIYEPTARMGPRPFHFEFSKVN